MKLLFKTLLLATAIGFFSTAVHAQDKKVKLTGYVKDSNNAAITDAVLFLDDVETNIKLNKQGFYSIKIDPNVKKIRLFSYSRGVKNVEYDGQKRIDFVFENNAVVARTKTKRWEPFQYKDIFEMIRSQVPGVRVVRNNTILMRGTGTITANTTPLLVVNNAPTNSIADILPQNVKSISILKGPEAATYGFRGANGVILITLKKKH